MNTLDSQNTNPYPICYQMDIQFAYPIQKLKNYWPQHNINQIFFLHE